MNTTVQAAIALTLLASTAAHSQTAVQWKVADGGNGHWYERVARQSRSWSTLHSLAIGDGGHLATVTSPAEKSFLVNNILAGNFCFIGGFQSSTGAEPAGDRQWVTGEEFAWTSWAGGEPNNYEPSVDEDVMAIWGDGLWADVNEDAYLTPCANAIFEWSADCNNDGIVDYGQCHDGTLPDYDGNNIPDCCEGGEACVPGRYPIQWKTGDGGNGHWYQARQCDCCFAQAAAIATSIGGQLASIDEAGEQSRVVIVVPSTRAAKLGGFREPDADQYVGWQWLSGRPFNPAFISWADGNPGCCGAEQYWLFLQATPGGGFGLHDGFNCAWPGSDFMLIEWSADCNNDGVVDYGQILQGQLADTNTDGVPDVCQCATNPSLPTCCPCDLDHDSTVGGADIGLLLSNWGPCGSACLYDLNNDDKVNGGDLGLLLAGWGPCQG